MTGPLGALALLAASAVCLVALFLVLELLFSRRVARTRRAAETMPARAFLLGLVNFLFLGALTLVAGGLGENRQLPPLQLISLLLLVLLLGLVTFGLSGMAQLTGD